MTFWRFLIRLVVAKIYPRSLHIKWSFALLCVATTCFRTSIAYWNSAVYRCNVCRTTRRTGARPFCKRHATAVLKSNLIWNRPNVLAGRTLPFVVVGFERVQPNGKDSREPKRYRNPKVRSSFLVIFDNQSANMSSPRMFIALRLRSYFKDQELLTNVLTSDRPAWSDHLRNEMREHVLQVCNLKFSTATLNLRLPISLISLDFPLSNLRQESIPECQNPFYPF